MHFPSLTSKDQYYLIEPFAACTSWLTYISWCINSATVPGCAQYIGTIEIWLIKWLIACQCGIDAHLCCGLGPFSSGWISPLCAPTDVQAQTTLPQLATAECILLVESVRHQEVCTDSVDVSKYSGKPACFDSFFCWIIYILLPLKHSKSVRCPESDLAYCWWLTWEEEGKQVTWQFNDMKFAPTWK